MRVICDAPLSAGWLVSRLKPPALSASFVVKGTYQLKPGGTAVPAPAAEFPGADVPAGEDPRLMLRYATDLVPIKLRTDLMLVGTCHAPGGKTSTVLRAGFRVGSFAKSVAVIGDRQWNKGLLTSSQTDPKPFTRMPVSWDRAWGGPGVARNPAGVGKGGLVLPNIENPDRLIRGPSDAVEPAGFGPIDPSWEPRSLVKGTFDKKWQKERWPWFPVDFDFSIYNAAPRDQQIEGYLKGDEEVVLENLHPVHAKYVSRLPGVRARCILLETVEGKTQFREAPLKLDTLWIDMDAEKLVLVWRGIVDVRSLKLKEIGGLLAVAEKLSDPPASPDFHRAALEKQMVPEPPDPPQEAPADLPPAAAPVPTAAVSDAIAARRSLAEADLSGTDLSGQDLSGVDLHGAVLAGASLRKANLAGADLAGADLTGADLSEADLSGANLAGADFTKARLPKANLAKAKVGGAEFERAALSGARLDECEGEKTSFVEADLNGASLKKAVLPAGDFSRAKLGKADFTGAALPAATIEGASAGGAIFQEAELTNFRASGKTDSRKADFRRAKAPKSVWDQSALDGADFSSAILDRASFAESSLQGAIFKRAILKSGVFADADVRKASFVQVNLLQGSFERANLEGADLRESNLYEVEFWDAKVAGADFRGANLKMTKLA